MGDSHPTDKLQVLSPDAVRPHENQSRFARSDFAGSIADHSSAASRSASSGLWNSTPCRGGSCVTVRHRLPGPLRLVKTGKLPATMTVKMKNAIAAVLTHSERIPAIRRVELQRSGEIRRNPGRYPRWYCRLSGFPGSADSAGSSIFAVTPEPPRNCPDRTEARSFMGGWTFSVPLL